MTPEQAAAELLRRRYARNSLVEFAQGIDVPGKPATDDPDEWLFKPVESITAAHHVLIMDTLDKIVTGEVKQLMIFAPPGSAKSVYASVVFPAYLMGKKPGTRVILASYASAIAWKQSRRTRQIVKSAKYRPIFNTALTRGNQSVEEWSLDNGSEYMADGLLAGLTGNRANLILIDDPVAGRADAESDTIRRKTKEAYEDDLKTRLVPGGSQILIQTRWHELDLAGGILPEGWNGESGDLMCQDDQVWRVLSIPGQADRADDPLGRKVGEWLWPEYFTEEHWAQYRSNPRTWQALVQQKPRPAEGAEFMLAWIQRYKNRPAHCNHILLVDPAAGRSKDRGDYTSMWVLALDSAGNRYIVDGVRDRLNLTERIAALFRLHRKWRPIQVRYEQYGLQADIEAVRAEQERTLYRFKINPVGGSVSKLDRIRRLIPVYQNGAIYHPEKLPYTTTTGEVIDLMKELEAEFAAFPVARHDDMMDALARQEEPSLALPFPSAKAQSEVSAYEHTPHDTLIGL